MINNVFFRLHALTNIMKKTCVMAISTLLLCAAHANNSYAAPAAPPAPAPSPCDPEYYKSLSSRAWLEAQREITQNQNLIFKPDSVLEYTCFDKFLSVIVREAPNMLSETPRWGTPPPGDLANAMTSLIGTALNDYLINNFNHTLRGGRSGTGGSPSLTYVPQASIGSGSYTCNIMKQVWDQAKCVNFASVNAEDGFFTFEEYQAKPDKRFLPTRCAGIPALWQTEIDTAYADELITPWIEDNVVLFFTNFDPALCGGSTPIPTGVIATRAKQTPQFYKEKICVTPGCYYVPTGGGNNFASAGSSGACQTAP